MRPIFPNLSPRTVRIGELAFCLFIGAALSVMMGQDANWDLRNYHLYTAFSVIFGRFDQDLLPPDLQAAYNPSGDFPYVLLAMGPLAQYPRILAAFMGLWFGLLVFVVLRIASLLFGKLPEPERYILIFFGTLTAVTGAAAFSAIGTTMNDIQTGMLTLAGLLMVLRTVDNAAIKPHWKSLLLGGVLAGMAGGIKLTCAPYAPAICIAMLAALPFRRWIYASIVFSAGWLAGFLPLFGWWGWFLWSRFGSPTFPMFNNIFRSPLAPPLSLMDQRFLPRDIWQWIFYPFYWAWNEDLHPVIEMPFRDPRMAIAYVALLVLAGGWFFKGRKKKDGLGLTRAELVMIVFAVLSYIGWVAASAVFRYAIPVEIAAVLVTLIIIMAIGRQVARKKSRGPLIAALAFCAICVASTQLLDWERVPYGDKVFDVDMSWTKPDTLFVAVIGPTAYLAAFVPPETHARFVAFGYTTIGGHGWPLGKRAQEMVRTNRGPIVVLVTDIMKYLLPQLPLIGLSPKVGPCRVVKSNLDAPLGEPVYACEAHRLKAGS